MTPEAMARDLIDRCALGEADAEAAAAAIHRLSGGDGDAPPLTTATQALLDAVMDPATDPARIRWVCSILASLD